MLTCIACTIASCTGNSSSERKLKDHHMQMILPAPPTSYTLCGEDLLDSMHYIVNFSVTTNEPSLPTPGSGAYAAIPAQGATISLGKIDTLYYFADSLLKHYNSGHSAGYITALEIAYGVRITPSGYNMDYYFRPVYLQTPTAPTTAGTYTYAFAHADSTMPFYEITGNNTLAKDTTDQYAVDMENYMSNIMFMHAPGSPASGFSFGSTSGDALYVVFPFQELYESMSDNACNSLGLYNFINENMSSGTFYKHDLFIAPPGLSIQNYSAESAKRKAAIVHPLLLTNQCADLEHMVPPDPPMALTFSIVSPYAGGACP